MRVRERSRVVSLESWLCFLGRRYRNYNSNLISRVPPRDLVGRRTIPYIANHHTTTEDPSALVGISPGPIGLDKAKK